MLSFAFSAVRLMEHCVLPTDTAWYADHLRAYTVGVLAAAQMAGCLGEVDNALSDSPLLWGNALFHRILRPSALRHCALHTG